MSKNWKVLSKFDSSQSVVETLLKNRGVTDIEEFLNPPKISTYLNKTPLDFKKSLKRGSQIVEKAISENMPIIIFGDYDSDGINATAILYKTLTDELNYVNVKYFIPNRFDHGYGLSNKAIDAALDGISEKVLIITVDAGITAVEESKYIKKLGHTLIITDHHQKPDKLPAADCIIWNDQMVGASVAWVFSKALGSKNPQTIAFAALGTVTDLYPLVGYNRALVKKGLEIINKKPPLGMKKLITASGKGRNEITTYDLGWVIGPRLNATGRILDATESLKLFIEKDKQKIGDIARKLNNINFERQEKTMQMFDLAVDFEEDNLPKIIFSANKDYHEGIIGLVAARLSQKYYRPAIVVAISENEAKGSVRSVSGINIIEFLRQFEDLFISLGGHPMAAGFSIEKENLDKLKKKLEKASKKIDDNLLVPSMDIDMEIPVSEISFDLLTDLEKLKPFGLGNANPVFSSMELGVTEVNKVGRDQNHLKFTFYKDDKYFKGIYFNGVDAGIEVNVGDKVDVAYQLKKNEFNGRVSIDLMIKDIRVI